MGGFTLVLPWKNVVNMPISLGKHGSSQLGVPCRARNSSYAAMPLLGFENLCPAAIPAINYGNLENPPLIYRYLQYLVGGIPTPLKNDGVRQLG